MGTVFLHLLLDDRPGNAGQVRGVADAVKALLPDAEVVARPIAYTSLAKLPNVVRGRTLVGVTDDTAARLHESLGGDGAPDVVIAAGRRTAPIARWIKHTVATTSPSPPRVRSAPSPLGERVGVRGDANAEETISSRSQSPRAPLLVQLMNPGRAGAEEFDLIVLPNHDCEKPDGDASNVMRVTGAPHRFSRAALTAEADAWRGAFKDLPRPWIALLVGGATRQKPFPPVMATALGAKITAMMRATNGSVLLVTSRRTGPEAEAALLAAVPQPRFAYLWGREQNTGAPNPYGGVLALADHIVVTGDSTSMCAEACAGAQPVYIYAPPGMAAAKHARLHRELFDLGLARPFESLSSRYLLSSWTHAPLNAADAVAARIVEMLKARTANRA